MLARLCWRWIKTVRLRMYPSVVECYLNNNIEDPGRNLGCAQKRPTSHCHPAVLVKDCAHPNTTATCRRAVRFLRQRTAGHPIQLPQDQTLYSHALVRMPSRRKWR